MDLRLSLNPVDKYSLPGPPLPALPALEEGTSRDSLEPGDTPGEDYQPGSSSKGKRAVSSAVDSDGEVSRLQGGRRRAAFVCEG